MLQADLLHVDREVWQAPAQRVPSQPQHAQRRRTHKRRQLAGQTPVLLHTRTPMYDQSQSLCCALSSSKGWAGVRGCFAPRDGSTLVLTDFVIPDSGATPARGGSLPDRPPSEHSRTPNMRSSQCLPQLIRIIRHTHVLLHTQDTEMGSAPDFMHGAVGVRMQVTGSCRWASIQVNSGASSKGRLSSHCRPMLWPCHSAAQLADSRAQCT